MSPQEAFNELPEQRALALIERMQPPREYRAPASNWAFGWINVEPDDFNEREERK